jgi:hypothetical protein
MTPIKLRHSVAAAIAGFTTSTLFLATTVFGGDDVYFGSFNNHGGQWALVNNTNDEPMGFHFIGFIPSRRQLIVGSPYYYDVAGGHFWDFGPPAAFEGEISGNGQVRGTATFSGGPFSLGNRAFPPPYSDRSSARSMSPMARHRDSWAVGPGRTNRVPAPLQMR